MSLFRKGPEGVPGGSWRDPGEVQRGLGVREGSPREPGRVLEGSRRVQRLPKDVQRGAQRLPKRSKLVVRMKVKSMLEIYEFLD